MGITLKIDRLCCTLDTCVIVDIVECPNRCEYLYNKTGFNAYTIYLNSQIEKELEQFKHPIDKILKILEDKLKAKVIRSKIPKNDLKLSNKLMSVCPTLHEGDAAILAYTKSANLILVTRDKDFLTAAEQIGVLSINPFVTSTIVINETIRKFHNIIKNNFQNNFQNNFAI